MKEDKKNRQTYFEASGHVSDEATALYVDALKLGDQSKLPDEILNHVQECDQCKNKILEIYSFLETKKYDIDNQVLFTKSKSAEKRISQRSWQTYFIRVAAVFLIIIASIVYFYKKADLDKMHVDDTQLELLMENFKSNETFDYLIDSEYRSASFKIITPKNDANFSKEILFQWEEIESKPLYIKIINNKGQQLFTYIVEGNQYLFKENIDPGLYYWKLENDEDVLHIGRFFINKELLPD